VYPSRCYTISATARNLQTLHYLYNVSLLCYADCWYVVELSLSHLYTYGSLASGCLVIVDPHDVRTVLPAVVLALIGVGGVLIPNQVVVTVITPDDLIGSVTALTVGLRSQAQVIGLALFYNRFEDKVLQNAYKYIVPVIVEAGVYNATVITNLVTGLTALPFRTLAADIPQLQNATHFAAVEESAIKCFSETFHFLWMITIPFGVTACIAALFMGDVSQYLDNHVAVVI
jgi:hypothetical protein